MNKVKLRITKTKTKKQRNTLQQFISERRRNKFEMKRVMRKIAIITHMTYLKHGYDLVVLCKAFRVTTEEHPLKYLSRCRGFTKVPLPPLQSNPTL